MEKRTERRKHFLHTNVAGFMYWDGCEAFSRLEIGTKLEMVREADNKHDCDAVALYYKDYKLGFIPGSENEIFAQFLDMGHSGQLLTEDQADKLQELWDKYLNENAVIFAPRAARNED